MPTVTAPARVDHNGQSSTYFVDSVGTTSTTYTYTVQQDTLIVVNNGSVALTLTVNGTNYTIQGNASQTVNAPFTAFAIVAVSGSQSFIATAVAGTTELMQLSGSNVTDAIIAALQNYKVGAGALVVGKSVPIVQAGTVSVPANTTASGQLFTVLTVPAGKVWLIATAVTTPSGTNATISKVLFDGVQNGQFLTNTASSNTLDMKNRFGDFVPVFSNIKFEAKNINAGAAEDQKITVYGFEVTL